MTEPFLTFKIAKLPLFGVLSPSTHPFTNCPICSGFDHLEKSSFGMACLFVSVSIVSGRRVMTLAPLSLAYSERLRAKE